MLRQLNQVYPGGMRRLGRRDCGVLGGAIPSTGDSSAPWMYPSLTLPADASKQYAYWIASHDFPFGLPLDDYSAGTIAGLPAGVYHASVYLEENDVILGPGPFSVTVTVSGAPVMPTVTTQPSAAAVDAPSPATFTYAFSDTTAVQAQRRANSGAAWANVSGAGLTSYTTPATSITDTGAQYRFGGTGAGGGPVYTDIVTLTVTNARPSLVNPVRFEDMLHLVLPYAPNCPPQTAVFHLQRAASDFFQRTLAWRADLPTLLTVIDQPDYALVVPQEAAIAKMLRYSYDGSGFDVIDAEAGLALQLEEAGTQVSWTEDRSTASVNPVPADAGKTLDFRVALKPSLDGQAIPGLMFEHYSDHIANGAISRILRMPDKDWTNPMAADAYESRYEVSVARTARLSAKGFSKPNSRRVNF